VTQTEPEAVAGAMKKREL